MKVLIKRNFRILAMGLSEKNSSASTPIRLWSFLPIWQLALILSRVIGFDMLSLIPNMFLILLAFVALQSSQVFAQPPDPMNDPSVGIFNPDDTVRCGDLAFMLDISSSMGIFTDDNSITR